MTGLRSLPAGASSDRLLLAYVGLSVAVSVVDVAFGRRYDEIGYLLWTNGIGLAIELLLVWLVRRGARWAWTVLAVLNVLGSVAIAVGLIVPDVLEWRVTPPLSFLLTEAVLVIAGTVVWFLPDVRPPKRRRSGPA